MKIYHFLLFSILLLSPIEILCQEDTKPKSTYHTYVIELNQDNFEEFNDSQEYYYLEFYAPWCTHCQQLGPIYEAAAKQASDDNSPYKYVKVDATKNENLAEKYKVESFPTILWIDNKESKITSFTGERDVETFINFAKKRLGLFNLKSLSSLQEFESLSQVSLTNKDNTLIIVLNKTTYSINESQIKKIALAAEEQGFERTLYTESPEIAESLLNKNKENSSNENPFYMFTLLYDKSKNTFYPYERIDFDFKDFLSPSTLFSHYKYKIFGEINNDEMNNLIERGEPTLILFHSQNKLTEQEQITMKEIAHKYRKVLKVFHSSISNKISSVMVEVLRIKEKMLPMLLLTEMKKGSRRNDSDDLDKFKLENVKISLEDIESFIKDWQNKKLSPFLASEDLREHPRDEFGIHKIVGLNFKEFITQQGKDIILSICSNLSKRCLKFSKIMINVAKKFRNNTNLILATTDPNFNEYDVDIPPKFPEIYFFPTDEDNLPIQDRFETRILFNGDFTTKNITEFIAINSRHNLVLETLDNEEKLELDELKLNIHSKTEDDESDFNFDDFLQGELGKKMQGDVDFDLSSLFSPKQGEEEKDEDLFENLDELENIPDDDEDDQSMDGGISNIKEEGIQNDPEVQNQVKPDL
jgi:protein disulfide-isomerase A1